MEWYKIALKTPFTKFVAQNEFEKLCGRLNCKSLTSLFSCIENVGNEKRIETLDCKIPIIYNPKSENHHSDR